MITEQQYKKAQVIPFDKDAARNGAKVITRSGHIVKIIDFDLDEPNFPDFTIKAEICGEHWGITTDGHVFNDGTEDEYDLFIMR